MSGALVREQGIERVVLERDGVWTCGACESQLFFLNDDGTVHCSRCQRVIQTITWQRVSSH
jgi:hypothetical protein